MTENTLARRDFLNALAATATGCLLWPAQSLAASSEIRISYNLPKDHPTGQFFEFLAKEIEKNTASTSVNIKTKTFPNGQLFTDAQLPDAISTGSVEIGQINIGFINSADASVGQVVNLPCLWNSWEAMWWAEDNQSYRATFQALFNKIGMHLIGFTTYGSAEFYANKPVKLPTDLKGLRLRSFGTELSRFMQILGASPVTLSSQEMYQATQRGTIDGFITGPSSAYERKLYEVVKYSSAAALLYISFPAAVNLKWWQNLPQNTQDAITKAARTAELKIRDLARNIDKESTQKIEKLGVRILRLKPEERAMWEKAAKPIYDDYLKRTGTKGAAMMEIVREANLKNPPI